MVFTESDTWAVNTYDLAFDLLPKEFFKYICDLKGVSKVLEPFVFAICSKS
jgi:hypothetical protein